MDTDVNQPSKSSEVTYETFHAEQNAAELMLQDYPVHPAVRVNDFHHFGLIMISHF